MKGGEASKNEKMDGESPSQEYAKTVLQSQIEDVVKGMKS